MDLTREENEMLEGKHGFPAEKSMEILVGLGECFEAKRMIPVTSAHLLANINGVGKGGAMFFQEMADSGAKFVIHTHTNPVGFESPFQDEIGVGQAGLDEQAGLCANFVRMGALLSSTCAPYMVGNVPRFREHAAWNESSAISFANSVLGARTNREGGPSAFAAAVTGRVPEYGLHLDENRLGDLKVVVTTELKNAHDFGTLGYFTGKIAEDRVPVFTGIPPAVSWDCLKMLGAAAAVSGSVALYHVVGVTPEAPDEAAAFGSRTSKGRQVVEFGEKEKRVTEESLSAQSGGEVDMVLLGCPHASVVELRDIARLLSGKKLKSGLDLWVGASHMVKAYGEAMGYTQAIEASGAHVLSGSCPMVMVREMIKNVRPVTVATDSPKLANGVGVYDPTGGKVRVYYRPPESCIQIAIAGGKEV